MAIEDKELDLSLNQLVEVPVKEIAAAHKAIHLDLSCNLIESLPDGFATLTHLVKIDLSKNKLIELPSNFGDLTNLQILDLYDNQLTSLPVSFCNLKSLKWLDLKNNPLNETLRHVAGDCLDDKECQKCAKKVVVFMQSINSDLEEEKEKKLKAIKEKRDLEYAEAEEKLLELSRRNKQRKEKKKEEALIRHQKAEVDKLIEDLAFNPKMVSGVIQSVGTRVPRETAPDRLNSYENASRPPSSFLCYVKKIFIFLGLLALAAFVYFFLYWEDYTEEEFILWLGEVQVSVGNYVKRGFMFIRSEFPAVKENLLQLVHGWMRQVSYYTSEIERIFDTLWQYFYDILFGQSTRNPLV